MTLPATFEQATRTDREDAALEYARRMVRQWRDGDNPWSKESPLTADGGALIRHIIRTIAEQADGGLQYVINCAELGDIHSEQTLRDMMNDFHMQHRLMPPPLATYQMEINRKGWRRPVVKDAKRWPRNAIRDLYIAILVADLCRNFSITATGRSARRRCACQIVREALEIEANLTLEYETIKTIWQHFMPMIAPEAKNWAA